MRYVYASVKKCVIKEYSQVITNLNRVIGLDANESNTLHWTMIEFHNIIPTEHRVISLVAHESAPPAQPSPAQPSPAQLSFTRDLGGARPLPGSVSPRRPATRSAVQDIYYLLSTLSTIYSRVPVRSTS